MSPKSLLIEKPRNKKVYLHCGICGNVFYLFNGLDLRLKYNESKGEYKYDMVSPKFEDHIFTHFIQGDLENLDKVKLELIVAEVIKNGRRNTAER